MMDPMLLGRGISVRKGAVSLSELDSWVDKAVRYASDEEGHGAQDHRRGSLYTMMCL